MIPGLIALVIAVAFIYLIVKLAKKSIAKQKADDEFSAAKKEYGWRMDKLKEMLSIVKTLAANGNQDAKIILQGVNECYLTGNLEHDPVTIVGHQTFISQYDKFVLQYKINIDNIGNISKSVKKANNILKSLPTIDFVPLANKYNKIIFFEVPKYDLLSKLNELLTAHNSEIRNLKDQLSSPSPDATKIASISDLVLWTLKALQNQIKAAQANVEFNDAQIDSAKNVMKKLKTIQQDLNSAAKLQGVAPETINKVSELLGNINTASNVDLSTDPVSALQVLSNVQNASLPLLKQCNEEYRIWKQSNSRQAPPRPGTNSRVAASQRHEDVRNQTRAQVMLREEQIQKQRHGGNNYNISSRTVVNSNYRSMDDDNYSADDLYVQPNIINTIVDGVIVAEIIEDIIQPPIQYGGGQTDGGGAGGNWDQPVQQDSVYTPEPVYNSPEPQQSYEREPDPEPTYEPDNSSDNNDY